MTSLPLKTLTAVLALPLLVLTGCPRDREEALTLDEATAALEQASDAGQAEGLTAASVDLSTHFTLGQALKEGAAELQTFITSQLPCAEVSVDGATLTVVYGAKGGNCSYRGHTFEGTHVIALERNDDEQVDVHHEWIGFSNGVVSLEGTADVTWSFADETRRVKHASQWKHFKSGRVGRGSGDRVQSLLDGGASEGIQVDGARAWDGERGRWELAIDGVQLRWTDPVPQAGSYTLTTPSDKALAMSFQRIDADTIRVEVSGPRRDFAFDVSKAGDIAESE
jgi:hypothetical protein